MKKSIGNNMAIETELPIQTVDSFHFIWKPGCHVLLELNGTIYGKMGETEHMAHSRIRIWLSENGEEQVLFSGCINYIKTAAAGKIKVEAKSASCLLDRKRKSGSCQNLELSYGEIVRKAAEEEGGRVIRSKEQDKKIINPVIQYEETVWNFTNRLADHLGIPVIADIITGNPNLWFGMRKGKEVPSLSEEQYSVDLFPLGRKSEITYRSQGNIFYKIGDYMYFLGQKLTITEVEAHYNHGELIFTYGMKDSESGILKNKNYVQPAGLGLWGTIRRVKGEKVMIALDIDEGRHTGDYFYPWQPDTGNAFYAMPEPGARALLYFYDEGAQGGAVIHCSNKKSGDEEYYGNRHLSFQAGNSIDLTEEEISFTTGSNEELSVDDDFVLAQTRKRLRISATSVWLGGRTISICTPDEFNISQS